MLRQGLGTTWGPSPAITLWLYTGVVRPALTYGAAVWASAAQAANHTAKLLKLQRLALLMIAPMRRNTPTAGLEVLFGVPPLQLYILSMATSTYNR
jgi:hypothetical protein